MKSEQMNLESSLNLDLNKTLVPNEYFSEKDEDAPETSDYLRMKSTTFLLISRDHWKIANMRQNKFNWW